MGRLSLGERKKRILHFPNLLSPESCHCVHYGNIENPNQIYSFIGDHTYLLFGGEVHKNFSKNCTRFSCSSEKKQVSAIFIGVHISYSMSSDFCMRARNLRPWRNKRRQSMWTIWRARTMHYQCDASFHAASPVKALCDITSACKGSVWLNLHEW